MDIIPNVFAIIDARLSLIENLLYEIKHPSRIDGQSNPVPTRRTMNVDEFCEFTGLSKQTVYKLTSASQVPFAKRGKRIWFDREEVENWLLSNQRATRSESERQVNEHVLKSAQRRAM
jgi:excisionase family DNA binding protein